MTAKSRLPRSQTRSRSTAWMPSVPTRGRSERSPHQPTDTEGAMAAVMSITEVKVPDIGDFKDVPVIELLVKPGDSVKPEQALITLESDKATMDVPAPLGGVVQEMRVKVGDKVSQGTVILTLVTASARAAPPPAASPPPPRAGEGGGGGRTAPASAPAPAAPAAAIDESTFLL